MSTGSTVADVIENHASTAPEGVAISTIDGTVLSWHQFANLLHAVGEDWQRLGIGSTDLVALCTPTDVPATPAVFLCVAAASGCLPLNPRYRLRECIEHMQGVQTRALVVFGSDEGEAVQAARSMNLPVIRVSAGAIMSGRWSARVEGNTFLPLATRRLPTMDDVALVLHTSGTTARSKIVRLTHGNLLASARQIVETLSLTPLDRCLNVMPLFHIHGLIGALLSSVVARSTFITSPELDPAEFRRWLTDAEATWFTAVPTILQAIAQAMRKDKGRAPASLRFVRSCSAPLPPQLATELETLLGIPVLQAYGMTEASHQISSNPLPPLCRKSSSVGLPTGFEIRILDDTHRILASGRRGEVCIAGPSLFGGYVDNPEANRASFVDGFFRTGDEGYLDDDGYLFLTGRLKEMINRGGEKIAPAEIDMVLLEHPSIAEAICFAISHPSLGEDIAAAVVVQTGTTVNLPSLQEFVSERLASHKIPQKLFILGALPKSPSGKVLRRELTARFREDVPLPSDAPAPHAEADREALMRRVWREVLDLDAVGLDDDYFMLGGDSLQAVTIIGKMKALGIELSMVDFVRRRSIRRMCAAMAIAA